MERWQFLSGCARGGGVLSMAPLPGVPRSRAEAAPHVGARTRLVDLHGRPLTAADRAPEANRYRLRLALEYREGRARNAVGIVRELAVHCRTTFQC